ncbi:Alanine--tRNA ligase [Entomophthora muscae]|uniref:Alanine--tRNA ligase n=1 Tax=Entomophthora muscae TaxID=34485 RepID=A0ACC2SFL3_9FUNG|nr:Alanine--tRNA ligase [Entomophthora muscae]
MEWPANKVREAYFTYFAEHGHTFVPSSPTIPHDDPTLLFANAGMNQYKPIFLGTADPTTDFGKLKRAYNAQKCIRAGGKHNDLDDVGKDVYHHTFFEMLGNWSFGDYFKKEALTMGWDLLTKVYKLPSERLYVTYYGGDPEKGLEPDNETRALWLELGLDASRILPFGNKENFWEMGDQGPCGPCSEIHFDRIGGRDASALVNLDDPDVLEIWNLVFIQFNREADGSLRPLPNKHVDTGMGLERLVSVMQNKTSNYDTDIFMPIFGRIQELTGARAYTGHVGDTDTDGIDMAYRVIADHVRTLLFAISDGGVPSNEGRGYVLRRILRRGCRYARRKFGVTIGTFFASIVDTVVSAMGEVYPEITKKVDDVKAILNEEEESFSRTLDRGERLFESCLTAAQSTGSRVISGADAWRLYDTFGFPLDLTHLMAEERGFQVDQEQFNKEQEKAKELSRKGRGSAKQASRAVILDVHDIAMVDGASVVKTNDEPKYTKEVITAKVCGLFLNHELHSRLDRGETDEEGLGRPFGVLLDQTNFYAESGGQEYDTGLLTVGNEAEFVVENVQAYGGFVLHTGHLTFGSLEVGQTVTASYDPVRRAALARNHTGTHILNLALRNVLQSEAVDQRGSLVAPEKLRFDFNCKGALTTKQLQDVEAQCNEVINKDLEVHSQEVGLAQGKEINGLRAVFGEVYPDPVRVVVVGPKVSEVLADASNPKWQEYSVEFCGGTHVSSTKKIGGLVLLEESSVAKGVRRIVALTGSEAKVAQDLAVKFESTLSTLDTLKGADLETALKSIGKELDAIPISAPLKAQFRERFNSAKKVFDDADKAAKLSQVKEVLDAVKEKLNSTSEPLVVEILQVGSNSKAIVGAITHAKTAASHAVYLFSADESAGRVTHQCYVPPSLIKKGLKASEWAGVVADIVGGKKGGKEESAQGSGSEVSRIKEAAQAASDYAKKLL